MIELTNCELFRDLTSIEDESKHIDLHNDYDFNNIYYSSKDRFLTIEIESTDGAVASDGKLYLTFENATLVNFNLSFDKSADKGTINSFYRGRFEINDDLFEYTPGGESFFHIEFEDGDTFEVFTNKVVLSSEKSAY